MNREQLRIFLAVLIAVVWTATVIRSFFLNNFTLLEIVTPVMLIVVGFIFGRKQNGGGNGNSK